MNAVFENGYAIVAGNVIAYNYDTATGEYLSQTEEYIHVGVSMPGNSTDIEPPKAKNGSAIIFYGSKWQYTDDHRGQTVYSTSNGQPVIVDYLGPIRDGYVQLKPATQYDAWHGGAWVTDTAAQRAAEIAQAETEKNQRLAVAQQKIVIWQTKILMGRTLTEAESTQLNAWIDYIDAVTSIDYRRPSWPAMPA